MAQESSHEPHGITVRADAPLIGIVFEQEGREVIRFFCSEEEADRAISEGSTEGSLALAGAWADLDWDEMEQQLHRIRHESPPSPPLSL